MIYKNEVFLKVDKVDQSYIDYKLKINIGFDFPENKYRELASLIKELKLSGVNKYKDVAFSTLFRSAINHLNNIFENGGYSAGSNAEKHIYMINNYKVIENPFIRRAIELEKPIYENLTLFKIYTKTFINKFVNAFLDFYIIEVKNILNNINEDIEEQTETNNNQINTLFDEEYIIQEQVNKNIGLIDEAISNKINQVIKDRINNAFSNKEFINNIISAELEKLKI